MTSQQQQQCYNRLARDAEVRRANEKQRKEAELLKKEEEMKKLFKPKINQKYSIKKGAAL